MIKSIIKSWRSKSSFIFNRRNREQDLWYFKFENLEKIKDKINRNHSISENILILLTKDFDDRQKHEVIFSLKGLHDLLNGKYAIEDIDKALLYLHHLNILELLKGRFINYSPMIIYKEEKVNNKRKYTNSEYKIRLEQHYQTKIESIHIMGEYAKRLKDNDHKAILFLKDYFTLSYESFKDKYKLLKEKISSNPTAIETPKTPIKTPRTLVVVNFSFFKKIEATIIVKKDVLAFSIEANPPVVNCCPTAISEKGSMLLIRPMIVRLKISLCVNIFIPYLAIINGIRIMAETATLTKAILIGEICFNKISLNKKLEPQKRPNKNTINQSLLLIFLWLA